jgi:DNA helicase-2/ATP-dependent DNA helicase PcrA
MAWFRLLQLLPGVGPAKARRAIDALRDESANLPRSINEALSRWPSVQGCLPEETSEMSGSLIAALASSPDEPLVAHADRLRVALTPLIEATYDDAAPRLEDLGALVLACTDAQRLSDVAAAQALDPPYSTGNLAGPPLMDEDWLVLSTVHSAKGLEFDAVHIIHAADGNFPSDMALGTPAGLEEERRLFYVAVTRARKDLAIYVPLRYHHHRVRDEHSWAQPSRFLTEAVRRTFCDVVRSDPSETAAPHVISVPLDSYGDVATQISQLW